MEKAKGRYERYNRTLIDVKAGIEHLHEKLQAAQLETNEHLPRNAGIVDVLYFCEGILTEMMKKARKELDDGIGKSRGKYILNREVSE